MVTHKQLFNRLILEQSDLITRKFDLYQTSAKYQESRQTEPATEVGLLYQLVGPRWSTPN